MGLRGLLEEELYMAIRLLHVQPTLLSAVSYHTKFYLQHVIQNYFLFSFPEILIRVFFSFFEKLPFVSLIL